MCKLLIVACFLASIASAQHQQQQQQYTTPVPILKQIDKHNDDGSYTFGYEAADKSFKIETKYPNGEVYGKYGYVDDQGKVREIEYGATKHGFQPAGSDINVPPPTITNNHPYPLGPNEIDDGQYREDPSVYYKDEKYNRPAIPASKFSLNNFQQPGRGYNAPVPQQPAPAPQYYNAPAAATPAPQPRYYQPPAYQQSNYYQPAQSQYGHKNYNYNSIPNHFHPAVKSLDIWSGSYSIDYTGRK